MISGLIVFVPLMLYTLDELAKNIAYGMRFLFYDERRETRDITLSQIDERI
ncbi:MAG: hypothetical protein JO297_12605 [Nitrososphaeraceae archaeon]|nr:hypothetical protein [Nitrososphaeraceae archaeon]